MKQTIKQAIANSSADYTEVRMERRWLNRVFFQREKLETLESATERGGVVRCLKNGGWGISVFNDPSKLAEHVHEATTMAAIVGSASSTLPSWPLCRQSKMRFEWSWNMIFGTCP